MKKKIYAMILSLTLAFSLAACGKPEVSGPVDRDPANESSVESSNEESSEEESTEESTEESSAETEDSSSALADWYNGNDRKALEDSLNQMFSSSGMNFSLSIEEPGTIIYTYQYTEQQSDGSNNEALNNYFRTSLDEQYQTFVTEIQNFKKAYGMPLTTIRITYLDADGTDLCTMDFTEDYVPSTDNTSSSGTSSQEYASLEDWMNSDEKALVVSQVNTQLASQGLSIEFSSEGNVMVVDYSYTEQQDLEGTSQEDIAALFDQMAAASFSSSFSSFFDIFESEYGLVLDDIKLVFRNADGTELYSKYYSEL